MERNVQSLNVVEDEERIALPRDFRNDLSVPAVFIIRTKSIAKNERSCYLIEVQEINDLTNITMVEICKVENSSKGERTRHTILEAAVNIASTEGLEGLSIGRLALDLSMSKSGLFAHFGSKQDLQLATLDAARSIFIREVVRPALDAGQGIQLLWRLCEMWFDYLKRGVFRGGCFFVAAASEFDGRPGPVRDRIGEIMNEWLCGLENRVRESQQLQQLDENLDPAQLAFEINAIEMGANLSFQLFKDERALDRGRHGVLERLRTHATPDGIRLLPLLDSEISYGSQK